MLNQISLPVKSFVVQVYWNGEPLSTGVKDTSAGVELGLTPTHATYDMVRWFPILTATVPATHAIGAPDIIVTVEHDAPVWAENNAYCGECQNITHQTGWWIATDNDDDPNVVTRCDNCTYYNWYNAVALGFTPDEGLWKLKLSGEYVALGATPIGKVMG